MEDCGLSDQHLLHSSKLYVQTDAAVVTPWQCTAGSRYELSPALLPVFFPPRWLIMLLPHFRVHCLSYILRRADVKHQLDDSEKVGPVVPGGFQSFLEKREENSFISVHHNPKIHTGAKKGQGMFTSYPPLSRRERREAAKT